MNSFRGMSQTGRAGYDAHWNNGEMWLSEEYNNRSKLSEVYSVILKHYRNYGFGPTVREIAKGANLSSPSTVHYHLKTLEKYKCIQKSKQLSRTIIPLVEMDLE